MSRGANRSHKAIAAALTVAVLAVAAVMAGRGLGRATPRTPEERIDLLYEAAARGDVTEYLDCFTGTLRQRLANELRERGEEAFRSYLKQSLEGVVGRAIRHDLTETLDNGRIRIVVERVYKGRPWERQAYRLQQENDTWRVYHIEPADVFEPPVPYGTPAFPDAAPPQIQQTRNEDQNGGEGRPEQQ